MPLFNRRKKADMALYNAVEKRTAPIISKKTKSIEVKGKVKAKLLNVRKKPDLNAKVIGQVSIGQILDVLNRLGEWYQVIYKNHKSGYVYAKYIELLREEKSGIVTAGVLNVREKPTTTSPILGKLHKNDVVNVLQELQEWLRIKYNNKEAYAYKQFISLSDVPIQPNPIVNSTTFFYERNDLASFPLQPNNPITVPSGYHEAIAAKTWNNYGGLIKKISDELQIDVATGLSVLCVESSGHGFSNDKMIIRFENHVLDMFWGKNNIDKFNEHFKYNKKSRRNDHYFRASKNDDWEVCHTSQEMEWKVLDFAMTLDETNALKSISMGAPQVMGFNHKFIGYSTPQEMFKMFNKDIRFHLLALFDFCKYKPERIRFLQRRDFYQFSVEYNGTAAPAQYEERLKKYYNIFRSILPS